MTALSQHVTNLLGELADDGTEMEELRSRLDIALKDEAFVSFLSGYLLGVGYHDIHRLMDDYSASELGEYLSFVLVV